MTAKITIKKGDKKKKMRHNTFMFFFAYLDGSVAGLKLTGESMDKKPNIQFSDANVLSHLQL